MKSTCRVKKHRNNNLLLRAEYCQNRNKFTYDDANNRGNYHRNHDTNVNDILECKQSTLGCKTGYGVFAREDLKAGDFVTTVHGSIINRNDPTYQAMKKTHIFQLSVRLGTVLSGIEEPLEGRGLGLDEENNFVADS